ncbi:MAG: DoxX family protein [Betaproteobacteria bacterium]|nr:DoxX family protein [Betaproteobacteria bacterium]
MIYDAAWLDTAGKLLISGFFVVAGLYNLTPARIKDHVDRLAGFGIPLPTAAFWFGMALQFTGCALLLTGWHADIGVLCLIVFTVVANAIFHRFWTVTDPARRNTLRLLLLNGVAILGGLLLLLQNIR